MLGESAGFMLFVVAWLHWVGDASEIVCETKLDDYHRGHVVLGGDFHGEVQLRQDKSTVAPTGDRVHEGRPPDVQVVAGVR